MSTVRQSQRRTSRKGKEPAACVKRDPEQEDDDVDEPQQRASKRGKVARRIATQEDVEEDQGLQQRQDVVNIPRGELAELNAKIAKYKDEALKAQTMAGISSTALDQLSAAVVRDMLFRYRKKPDVPVKREDLAKTVGECPAAVGKKNASTAAIAAAQYFLASVCGLDMKRIEIAGAPTINAKGIIKEGANSRFTFVLRSLVPNIRRAVVERPLALGPPIADAVRALRFIVLEMIHLNGGELAEDELWRHMGHVGVYQDAAHTLFGKAEDQLTAMILQRQITEQRSQGADGTIVRTFSIGENAKDEVGLDTLQQVADEFFAMRRMPNATQPQDSE